MMQEGGIPVRALSCVTVLAAAPVVLRVQAPVCAGKRAYSPRYAFMHAYRSKSRTDWYSHARANGSSRGNKKITGLDIGLLAPE